MWGSLLKGLFAAMAPKLQPILEELVKNAIEQFLKNLGSGTTASGTLALSSGVTADEIDAATKKTVEDLLKS